MGQHQLSDHTTLRLGGPAPLWLSHTHDADWPNIARTAAAHAERPFTLGGGSNTLAPDQGTTRPVIHMATRGIRTRHLAGDQVVVTVAAGHPLTDLVAHTVAEGLSGIEYLGGIPGTAGAAPVQNAGAYGQEIGDRLTAVIAHDWTTGRTTRVPAAECRLDYRTSVFKQEPGRWTILSLTLHLTRSAVAAPVTYQHLATALRAPLGSRPPLAEAAAAVLHDRAERGLLLPGTGHDARQAGSCFLNPIVTDDKAAALRCQGAPVYRTPAHSWRASAGWLLEACGYRPGAEVTRGVRCSTQRTLTLTAQAEATAHDFRTALEAMAANVRTVAGVDLHPEPVLV
ncbi:UDP-N-acetylmuramate dehydrogenase [Streptomyces sp. NPDC004327]|uniref:UDP-N-acetylmuramate dehydrogenase n=1 Tax=Streptomyces sp. NPDC004327 TaxID=3364699 RepID=UPI0036C2048E